MQSSVMLRRVALVRTDVSEECSAMSVLTRATWRNIPEDCILHSHCRENLKSYTVDCFLSFDIMWAAYKTKNVRGAKQVHV
jgi:hypothetical protein